jgi:hypothetical protein
MGSDSSSQPISIELLEDVSVFQKHLNSLVAQITLCLAPV